MLPRKNDPPLVRFLSSTLPTQFASIYVVRVKNLLLEYHKVNSKVPLRYMNIFFTTCTWVSFGASWNHATNPTACIMSNLDAITYSRMLIIDMYTVLFSFRDSSCFLNLQPVTMGVLLVQNIPFWFLQHLLDIPGLWNEYVFVRLRNP
jgi:hypothetical protein